MKFDFLFCSERSGSNLITQMMDSHPEISGPFSTQLMNFFLSQLYKYGNISEEKNWRILVEDILLYLESMHSTWQSSFKIEEVLTQVKERSFKSIHRWVYEHEAGLEGKKRLFIKDNHAYKSIGYTEASFDKPRYVWLIRDPRDAVVSLLDNGIMNGGAKHVCGFWNDDQYGFLKAYTYLNAENRIIKVLFEDLLSNTEEVLKKICDFMGIDFDKQMLEFHKKDSVETNAANVSAWSDLNKPIIKNNFNLYKKRLNEVQIKYVEYNCMELMDYFGYKREFSTYEAPEVLENKLSEFTEEKPMASNEEKELYARWYEVRGKISARKLY